MTSSPSLRILLDFAVDAAWQAGRITLGYFQREVVVERKGDQTPVTAADREAEAHIRDLIGRYWPDHGILGEEFGQVRGSSPYRWILDPIDGTKSFVCGVPLYSTLVALLENDSPVVGVINVPALDEIVYASRGGGCHWNGRVSHVSEISSLQDAVLLGTDLDTFARYGKADAWRRLVSATYLQRTWGDAYGYTLVATGRAEIMVDPIMSVWDCGPLQVILEEAGGTFTDWEGNPTIFGENSIATNGALFGDVMQLVRAKPL
jgi:histidinol phosphatase-like enzyme (inositol monophosphatase family)